MSPTRAKVRAARPTDIEDMLTLLAAAELPLEGVAKAPGNFLVAEVDGRVIALGGLEAHGPDALLRSVAVAGAHRGRGLGTAIFDQLWQRAIAVGYDGVYLLTTTAEDYFACLGFDRIDRAEAPSAIRRSAEFRDLCPASAVLMRRLVST
jgi:amino-acid N-acetyltransferase